MKILSLFFLIAIPLIIIQFTEPETQDSLPSSRASMVASSKPVKKSIQALTPLASPKHTVPSLIANPSPNKERSYANKNKEDSKGFHARPLEVWPNKNRSRQKSFKENLDPENSNTGKQQNDRETLNIYEIETSEKSARAVGRNSEAQNPSSQQPPQEAPCVALDQYGRGSNSSYIGIQWQNGHMVFFQYNYDTKSNGAAALKEIASQEPRLKVHWILNGAAVEGLSWDTNNDGVFDTSDWHNKGWSEDGFWGYWIKENKEESIWLYSDTLATSRHLHHGSVDLWAWGKYMDKTQPQDHECLSN